MLGDPFTQAVTCVAPGSWEARKAIAAWVQSAGGGGLTFTAVPPGEHVLSAQVICQMRVPQGTDLNALALLIAELQGSRDGATRLGRVEPS